MSALPNRSQALFEQYKDHPVVKALIAFLQEHGRELSEVVAWECEIEKLNSSPYELFKQFKFSVLFKDSDGFQGEIVSGYEGSAYMVYKFQPTHLTCG